MARSHAADAGRLPIVFSASRTTAITQRAIALGAVLRWVLFHPLSRIDNTVKASTSTQRRDLTAFC